VFLDYFCIIGNKEIKSSEILCLVGQTPGLVNVDFADVRAVMSNSGTAMLGVGSSSGKNRAEEAAVQAASAPLIERSIEQATGIVYNITGGSDLTLQEVNTVSQVCTRALFYVIKVLKQMLQIMVQINDIC